MNEKLVPEVQTFQQQPRFFHDKNRDYVEISYVGSKDTMIRKVDPEIMARFREEWNAYCDGRQPDKRPGIALTEVEGISTEMAEDLIRRNVHNLEEMAALNDLQCQQLGHGMLTLRKRAIAQVHTRRMNEQNEMHNLVMAAAKTVQTRPEQDENTDKEIAELREQLSNQNKRLDAVIEALGRLAAPEPQQPRRRGGWPKGKPRKVKENGSIDTSGHSDPEL